jgi:hypothetical protein
MAFLLLLIAIVTNVCTAPAKKEGFANSSAKAVPSTNMLLGAPLGGNPVPYTSVSTLPSAPVTGLAQTNPLPFQDPALEKSAFAQLTMLKMDMDGFAANELPYLMEYSDPSIKLPLTRFKGDYQRVKDELLVIQANPGLQPQVTMADVDVIGANLRNLQRVYRTYANNDMVPPVKYDLSRAGAMDIVVETATKVKANEGFTGASSSRSPVISVDQLKTLNQKITVEVLRLQASGTNDPVIQARVALFSKVGQSVSDIQTQVANGTLLPADIPITQADYANFLPSLGDTSAGVSGLISKSGNSTLSSLFNSYDKGDISGSQLASNLVDSYATTLLQGLSLSYTSPNQVLLAQAQAQSRGGQPQGQQGQQQQQQQGQQQGQQQQGQQQQAILQALTGAFSTRDSFVSGRGEFDQTIQQLSGSSPAAAGSKKSAGYDWKSMAKSIRENIQKMSLSPADFGCIEDANEVSKDFSWRGHCKMVCSRLATHYDPGIPAQVGCPPATWKGWRL